MYYFIIKDNFMKNFMHQIKGIWNICKEKYLNVFKKTQKYEETGLSLQQMLRGTGNRVKRRMF